MLTSLRFSRPCGVSFTRLDVARFEPGRGEILRPEPVAAGERIYRTPAPEFELGLIDVSPGRAHGSPPGRGVELLLGLQGDARLLAEGREQPLGKGRACFVPAAVPAYRIDGAARICRARVGVASAQPASRSTPRKGSCDTV